MPLPFYLNFLSPPKFKQNKSQADTFSRQPVTYFSFLLHTLLKTQTPQPHKPAADKQRNTAARRTRSSPAYTQAPSPARFHRIPPRRCQEPAYIASS